MGQTEPFIGREAEIAALAEALLSDASVVTLTGLVGVGKSRMAEAVLAKADHDHAFEATLVADATVLARAARALGLTASEDRDEAREIRRIGLALQQRGQALLLLDGLDAARGAVLALPGRTVRPCFAGLRRDAARAAGDRVLRRGAVRGPVTGPYDPRQVPRRSAARPRRHGRRVPRPQPGDPSIRCVERPRHGIHPSIRCVERSRHGIHP